MARGWTKFGLLLWKNWVLQKRHKIQTAVEVMVPVLLSMLLVLIRSLVIPEKFDEPTYYQSFSPNPIPPFPIPIPPEWDRNWFIAWSPNGSVALQSTMEQAAHRMRMTSQGFESEEVLNAYLTSPLGPDIMRGTLAGVIFNDEVEILAAPDVLPKSLTMTYRFPGESRFSSITAGQIIYNMTTTPSHLYSWWTNYIYPLLPIVGPRWKDFREGGTSPGYFLEQFLSLQQSITTNLLKQHSPDIVLPVVEMQRFPYPAYMSDPILQALEAFMALIIMLSFVYSCISTVKVVTTEKEKQLKEAMKIMGLPNWLHWLAWFIKTFTFLIVSAILITVLLNVSWYPGSEYSVFTYSDPTVVFVFLMLYVINTITFCFMISVFFSKANTAATVAGLIWFLSYAPYSFMYYFYGSIPTGSKIAACLAGNTAMAYGFQLMIQQEGTREGSQWNNLWTPARPDDTFVVAHVMLMLIIDAALYMLITIYVEAVFPGDFGVPQRWNFFMKKSYWSGKVGKGMDLDAMAPMPTREGDEPEPTHLRAGVQIKNLTKKYGKKTAVDDLNLNMYEGQITVLLGHNGAGKTTTMSMLTGMITPTKGTATVSGYDIKTNIEGVRDSLGLCPQHNVLFEELTVREHLYFFGKLKGLDGKVLEAEIMKYIRMMDLLPKENKQSSTLSGGMQRKLSACVALCGNSKVVMFDEPTSGMDPTARRTLWDLLQAEKKGRTMLLSTHFMDEADLLGDRIAIMAGGQLQCVGSSFFLKKKYGEGYRLVIVKDADCDINGVTELLRRFLPDVAVSQNIGTELSYLLREESSAVFEDMFAQLEQNKERLRMLSYGVSLTTMEEVFMKAGKDKIGIIENGGAGLNDNNMAFTEQNGNGVNHNSTTKLDVSGEFEHLTGFDLTVNQMIAMITKKAIYTKRTWLLTFIQTFLVVFFLALTFIIAQFAQGTEDLPSLPISLQTYKEYQTTVNQLSTREPIKQLYDVYVGSLDNVVELEFGANFSDYIVEEADKNLAHVSKTFIVGASFASWLSNITDRAKVIAYFNNQVLHSPPLAMNLVYDAVLKNEMGSDYEFNVINFPLPFTDDSKFSQLMQGDNLGFQISFNMGFGMAFATAFYVLFTVRERESRAKLLQFVSGVGVLTFWSTALVWDLVSFLLPIFGVLITMVAFQQDGFSSAEDFGYHLLILLLFNWATMPLMYIFSFFFSIPSTGYTRVAMFSILGGCAMFMTVTILEYPALDLVDVAAIMDHVLLVIPHYNLAMSFRSLYTAQAYGKLCMPVLDLCGSARFKSPCCKLEEDCGPSSCIPWVEDYFSLEKPGIGRHLLYYTVDGFVFIAILLLIEYHVFDAFFDKIRRTVSFRRCCTKTTIVSVPWKEPEDQDVADERHRIRNMQPGANSYSLLLRDVTKYYDNFLAVDQLCVGIRRGECFGLLGVNGAGKTTTFKMMTGDEKITSGDAFVQNFSLRTNMKQVYQLIGYCPQFDALIDDLTGRETLNMFCLLRGIPRPEVRGVVDQLANDLLFTQHIDKKVKEYSGGNKRKLSTAVALVGDPPVVYLDEPTTGMDPVAKRHLWNVICKVRDGGKVIVLTSHSMEECEALCTRSAIMVNGEFKCLGSTQHLKNKFAEGYTLNVKAGEGEQGSYDIAPIKAFMDASFPGSELREEYQGLLSYYIQNPTITWSRMFGMMEKAKKALNIVDYAVGQTSLEQVFLTFTKRQREEAV